MTVKKPSITMSSLDWERLDRLVNLETYSRLPGVEALEEENHLLMKIILCSETKELQE